MGASEECEAQLQSSLCTVTEELSSAELSERLLSEKAAADLEHCEHQREKALEELEAMRESTAKASCAHRDTVHNLGEKILSLEENVEQLDFAWRRSKHTASEESVEAREAC